MKRYKVIYEAIIEAENIYEAFDKEEHLTKKELRCKCIGECNEDKI